MYIHTVSVPVSFFPVSFPAEPLHPGLWRASQVGRPHAAVFASGFAELDRVLPGGGWPAGVLTELLLPHPGVGELRLLAPVLAALQRQQQERCLMWFDPPAAPCAWALRSLGLSARQLVLVRAGLAQNAQRVQHVLWALEHALKSGHVGAVLAWLPLRLPADGLRRLQLAAQAHEGPAFLLRGDEAARHASPAPLRLRLAAAAPDQLQVQVLKRRGPPLAQPLLLQLPPVLAARAAARARAGSVVPAALPPLRPLPRPLPQTA
ncbi:MAG: translesion DNA synthesis-associated protein ImuA [Rubrivivax sp.]|nr:translesion DNA synthesis-associated protein ImuA [Rubrivivax sp.]